jgi:hypothetical protein
MCSNGHVMRCNTVLKRWTNVGSSHWNALISRLRVKQLRPDASEEPPGPWLARAVGQLLIFWRDGHGF